MDTAQLVLALAAEAALVLGAASSLRKKPADEESAEFASPQVEKSPSKEVVSHLLKDAKAANAALMESMFKLGVDPLRQCEFAVNAVKQQPDGGRWFERQMQQLTRLPSASKRRRVQ